MKNPAIKNSYRDENVEPQHEQQQQQKLTQQIKQINGANNKNHQISDSSGDGGGGGTLMIDLGGTEIPQKMYNYGWFNMQPKFLQRFLSAKWALFWLCWAGAMQGLLVNGCINVVITTIERRFGLRSSQTGLVASGYDIASFVCLVPVTYFGGRIGASKPRWLGWGVILMGLGSLTFALPHFLVGPYRASGALSNVCTSSMVTTLNGTIINNVQACSTDSQHPDNENLSWNVWLFFLAQLLHGAGASPLFTLGVTYIDENVSKKMSSVYLGIYYTMAIIGPAVGYVVGGQLLLIYTDFVTIDAAVTLGLTPQSKVWVGAWWIGFIFIAILCVLLSLPILAYPPSLPGGEEIQQEKVSEAHNGNTTVSKQKYTKLKDMPEALCALLKNPTFFFLNLAGASEGLIIAGFAAFLPKQIENQFSVTAVWSAMLMGLITVPAGGGGTFLGGYLVKKFNLNCSGIIKLCLMATIVATIFTVCFFFSCPNLLFAGVTSSYTVANPMNLVAGSSVLGSSSSLPFSSGGGGGSEIISSSSSSLLMTPTSTVNDFNLDNSCNIKCGCNRRLYDPICGVDGIMYYSPCHAGCTKELSMDNSKVYLDCDCITTTKNGTKDRGFDAINTMCPTNCNNLWYFVGLCFMVMLFTFLATMPALSATLRCVHDDQRSFALGIQWIKVRILGTIPAPMIFGRLIDETCILWQESCDDAGSCLVYDNQYMSKYMMALAVIGKACSILFFFCAWWCYIPPKQVTTDANNENNSDAHQNGVFPSSNHKHIHNQQPQQQQHQPVATLNNGKLNILPENSNVSSISSATPSIAPTPSIYQTDHTNDRY